MGMACRARRFGKLVIVKYQLLRRVVVMELKNVFPLTHLFPQCYCALARLVTYSSTPAIKNRKMFGYSKKCMQIEGFGKESRDMSGLLEPHPHPGPPLEGEGESCGPL
jgi:hypothetical protein